MKSKMKIAYMALLALIVWFAIILQFYISIQSFTAKGRTVSWTVVELLSYFTIENNILVALSLTLGVLAPASLWGRFFSRVSVLGAIAMNITIVGLIYALILKHLYHLEGLFALADNIFHVVCPLLFVAYWLFFVPKENTKWVTLFTWLIYPLLYLFYVLVRGAIGGDYPYPFVDAATYGYAQVATNSFFILLAFMAVGACFISVSRLLHKDKA